MFCYIFARTVFGAKPEPRSSQSRPERIWCTSDEDHDEANQMRQSHQQNHKNILRKRNSMRLRNASSTILLVLILQQETSALSFYTSDEFQVFAADQGITISRSNLGPAFRFIARTVVPPADNLASNAHSFPSTDQEHSNERANDGSISVGYLEGINRSPVLQLDTIRVSKPKLKEARAMTNGSFRGGGSVFGVSLLLGYASVLYGYEECRCPRAEFLAIDDSELQHKRLVKFYSNAGFERVKYVGDGLFDIPDRLVWGGCGTLLRQDCKVLLDRWSKIFDRSKERAS
jgi:hypothetical protein